jgi:hypothetical protein
MITYEVRVYASGYKEWYLNGQLHREDGPAIEYADGDKAWWFNDQRHREDGPAVEGADGYKAWYLNGKKLTEDEFNSRNQNYITIEGKTAKLSPETVSQLKKLLD